MQLVDTMQSGGATTTSKTTNFSPQQLELFFASIATLIRALGTKNTYALVSVLEKRPLKIPKLSISVGGSDKWAPYFDSFEA